MQLYYNIMMMLVKIGGNMIYRTDANGLVIGIEAERDDEQEEARALRLQNKDGVYLYKMTDGQMTPRNNLEIMLDTQELNDLFPVDDLDITDDQPPIADRVEALEQALELLLSGEVE